VTLILKLEPDVEAGLAALASAKGLSLDLYVRSLLKQFAAPANSAEPTPEQKAAAFEQLIEGLPPQNLVEFWSVATRPAQSNGLGLSLLQAEW
jgi:hypothetical protein